MKTPFAQRRDNPVHCIVCIQLGRATPATWHIIDGRPPWLHACNEHADEVDEHGLQAVKRYRKNQQ